MQVEFSIDGAAELDKVLQALPPKLRKKVLGPATRSGALIIRKEAESLAPYDEGRESGAHLKDEIIARKKRRTNDIYQVGPSSRVPHAHLVEYGTGPRVFKNPHWVLLGGYNWVYVTHAGTMTPQPFLRPAVDNKGREAVDKIGQRLGELTERWAARLAGEYKTSGLRPSKRRYRR